MRRYGLVDIPDQASDIDAVPITRTITINGTTFDLSADRTYTVGGMAIGGTITSATPGSVLFAGTSGVLAQDNANFFWDDTNNRLGIGTTTPSNKLSIVETTNVASGFNVTNTTAGTSNSLNMNLVADTTAGYLQFQKRSSTHTATGIANASSGLLYNSEGDLIIGTGGATSWIRFATNGIATADMNLTANGRLLLGTSTESSYILDVQGENSRFGGTTNYTVLYSQANGGGIGLFKSDILLSNLIQNELNISAGIATGDVISIYCSDTLVPGTVRPLCINGNGRETVFGSDTTSNTASSLVTMVSTTKGFLPPRMTSTQRTAISSPATGLIVYQTDSTVGLYLRNSSAWVLLGSGAGTVTDVSVVSANGLAGTVATSTTTPAITLSTTVTGLLKGNGTAISAAVLGTDYVNSNLYTANGGLFSARTIDFVEYPLYIGTYTEYGNFAFHRKGVIPGLQILALSADRTLSNLSTQQAFFLTSFNSLTLVQQTTYFFSGLIYITTMSGTSGNITLDIKGAGTCTIASIMYFTTGLDSSTPTTAAALSGGVSVTTTYTAPVIADSGTGLILKFEGTLRIALLGGGTIIPSIALTTAVGTAVAQNNSYFQIYPVSNDSMKKVEVTSN